MNSLLPNTVKIKDTNISFNNRYAVTTRRHETWRHIQHINNIQFRKKVLSGIWLIFQVALSEKTHIKDSFQRSESIKDSNLASSELFRK